jgi:hypothetical protein
MTLDELIRSLPNGFHDARLARLSIDFVRREARLELDIWVAEDLSPEQRETYRSAEVVLSGLLFWVSEPPRGTGPFDVAGPETIDVGAMDGLAPEKRPSLPPVPSQVFVGWIYFGRRNAFDYVAARDARLIWTSEAGISPSA